jgi:hypothetical protein
VNKDNEDIEEVYLYEDILNEGNVDFKYTD